MGIDGRAVFTGLENFPAHNLYASIAGSLALMNHLTVRDVLRKNASLAREYGELKTLLAKQDNDDIDSYVEGKSLFLSEILKNNGFKEGELKEIRDANKRMPVVGE